MPNDTDNDTEALDLAAYVQSSQYRMAVLEVLREKPTNPSEIAEFHDKPVSHISRALKELREKEIVSVHGTDSRRKLYQLTDTGRAVTDLVDELGGVEE